MPLLFSLAFLSLDVPSLLAFSLWMPEAFFYPSCWRCLCLPGLGCGLPRPTREPPACTLRMQRAPAWFHAAAPDGACLPLLPPPQCRELLGAFGEIKTFDLIRDRQTGQSKG